MSELVKVGEIREVKRNSPTKPAIVYVPSELGEGELFFLPNSKKLPCANPNCGGYTNFGGLCPDCVSVQ